ncbi:hypothetical protein [Pseudovibrio exalbescens]|uniref:hypothetical protein n=1 Tax=Pseudovibrio exalbescens TaxID=197461 RepID=UPI000C9AA0D6|nr:hypothetical protein [Pseudovibrio exalbescens]
MPLQNRVAPTGELFAVPQKGLFMGNRGGRHHDPETKKLLRPTPPSKRWICCQLDFKNRHRSVWGHSYTELFFLDEVTALAAGHRPCFECQRSKARTFARLFTQGMGTSSLWSPSEMPANEMDAILHSERGITHPITNAPEDLPVGTIVSQHSGSESQLLAKGPRNWLRWNFDGYCEVPVPDGSNLELITPPCILRVLKAGYEPVWHPSTHKEINHNI